MWWLASTYDHPWVALCTGREATVRRYSSFLVRCWTFDGDTWRIQIEHLQSGERTLVASPEAAMEWIRVTCDGSPLGAQGDDAHQA